MVCTLEHAEIGCTRKLVEFVSLDFPFHAVRVDVYSALNLNLTPGKTRSSAFTMVSIVEVNS